MKTRLGIVGAIAIATACLAGCPGNTSPPVPVDGGAEAGDATTGPPEWRTVVEGLDGALLSIWGASERDVWAVGGPLGNTPFESLVMRFDGTQWKRVKPGKAESFWWVHGTGASDVWLVGEKGRITHWDGAQFREDVSGTDATLFGVFAFAANDVWAVGGVPESKAGTNDVVLHYNGTSWKPEALPQQNKTALFKVWGSSPNDIYVVGENAVIWHRKDGQWKREGEGVAKSRLTTVTGCSANRIYAVGGRDLLQSDGTTWSRVDLPQTVVLNDLNGVACAPPNATKRDFGDVVVAGGGSLKLRLVNGKWESDFGSKPFADLHGAWIDPRGAMWGAGGQFSAAAKPNATRNGTIARYAPDIVSGTIAP